MATETQQASTTIAAPPPNGAPPAVAQTPADPKAPVVSKPAGEQAELALTGGEAPAPKADAKVDAKPEEKKSDEKTAPVALKLPDGLTSEDPAVKALVDLATKSKIPVEAQQALLDQHVALVRARDTALVDAFKAERAELLAKSKADPEIGGANWNKTLDTARRGLVAWADQDFRDWLDATNGTNHPAVIRFIAKASAGLREDTIAGAEPAKPDPTKDPEASLKARYPTMFPKEK